MIKINGVSEKHAKNLEKNGIPNKFAFGQVRINIKVSPDERVNNIIVDMLKSIAGLRTDANGVEIKFVTKIDSSIKNSNMHSIFIEESKIVTNFLKKVYSNSKPSVTLNRLAEKHNLNQYGNAPFILYANKNKIMDNEFEECVHYDDVTFSFARKERKKFKIERADRQNKIIGMAPEIDYFFNNLKDLSDEQLIWFISNVIEYREAKTFINKLKKQDMRLRKFYGLVSNSITKPMPYSKFVADGKFPFDYIYQVVNGRNDKAQIIGEVPPTITQEEASEELEMTMRYFFKRKGKHVLLLRTDTGTGKTTTVMKILVEGLENIVFAFPTHALALEFMEKVKKIDPSHKFIYIPELPDFKDLPNCKEKSEGIKARRLGNHRKASSMIKKIIKKYGTPEQKRTLEKYNQALQQKTGTLVITHKRLMMGFLNNKKYKDFETIVIDEDIFPSLFSSTTPLFNKTIKLNIENFIKYLKSLPEYQEYKGFGTPPDDKARKAKEILEALKRFKKLLDEAQKVGVLENKERVNFLKHENLMYHYLSEARGITIDMMTILKCHILTAKTNPYKKQSMTIFSTDLSNILYHKKILMMSATIDEEIHGEHFRKNINVETEFYDVGRTEIKGKIICHTTYNTTKSGLTDEKIREIDKQIMKHPYIEVIITLKSVKYKFSLPVSEMHFGNVAGYDSYKGKSMAIVGTLVLPPEYIATLSYFIYKKIPKSFKIVDNLPQYEFDVNHIRWQEFLVPFTTFNHEEDEEVRRLHLWTSYAELLQAVGRARLTQDCSKNAVVHVYSRLPVPQAILK